MSKTVAIKACLRRQKGNTAMLLTPLIQVMKDPIYDVESNGQLNAAYGWRSGSPDYKVINGFLKRKDPTGRSIY